MTFMEVKALHAAGARRNYAEMMETGLELRSSSWNSSAAWSEGATWRSQCCSHFVIRM